MRTGFSVQEQIINAYSVNCIRPVINSVAYRQVQAWNIKNQAAEIYEKSVLFIILIDALNCILLLIIILPNNSYFYHK